MSSNDRDPVAAARRVSADELGAASAGPNRFARDIDQRAADMRDAAILNTIILAKSHGLSQEMTETDVERWRKIRSITDDLASGANETESIPIGFGAPVRARQTEALMKIATKAIPAAQEEPSA